MKNFLFCSIYMYLSATTQESDIILTTCDKTPKNKLYYKDVVFIKGKDYTYYNADS